MADGSGDLFPQTLLLPQALALPLSPELALQQPRVESPVETRARVEAVQRRRPAQTQEQDLLIYTGVKQETLQGQEHGCSSLNTITEVTTRYYDLREVLTHPNGQNLYYQIVIYIYGYANIPNTSKQKTHRYKTSLFCIYYCI